MKVLEAEEKLIERGIGDAYEYKIAQSAKVMDMLSNKLYKNKPKAVIRELSTNAWDAHVEAGTTDKVPTIELPSYSKEVFKIRDYGTGMSKESLEKMYTTYGESTKTHSNDFNGCMGIGSKSPFAYCRSFTTISYYNGMKHIYINAKDANNMPTLRHVSSVTTEEPNGLEISFSVKSSDILEFQTEAQSLLKHFPVAFNVIKDGQAVLINPSPKYLVESEDGTWRLPEHQYSYYSSTHKSVIIMGYVEYPIDLDKFKELEEQVKQAQKAPEEITNDWYQYYKSIGVDPDNLNADNKNEKINYQQLLNLGFELYVPIGTVEMDISREGLQYTPSTVEYIKGVLKRASTEIGKTLEEKIKSCKTLYEAKVEAVKITKGDSSGYGSHNPLEIVIKNIDLTWNGNVVNNKTEVLKLKDGLVTTFNWRSYHSRLHKLLTHQSQFRVDYRDKNYFFVNNMERGGQAAVRRHIEDLGDNANVYLFQDMSDEDFKVLYDELGIVESDLVYCSKVPKKPKTKSTTRKKYEPVHQYEGNWVDGIDVDFEAGGYFLELNNWKVYDVQGKLFDLPRIYTIVKHVGIVTLPEIYAVKTKSVNKYKKSKDWKCFITWLKKEVKKFVDKIDEQDIAKTMEYQYVSRHKDDILDFLRSNRKKIDSSDVQDLLSLYDQYEKISEKPEMDNLGTINELLELLGFTDNLASSRDEVLSKMITKFKQDHPIVDVVSTWQLNRSDIAPTIVEYINMKEALQIHQEYDAQTSV